MSRWRKWLRRLCLASALAAAGWWVLPKPDLLPPTLEYSRVVADRHGEVLNISLTSDGKLRLPVKLDSVSPDLIEATLVQEDRRFWQHPGVNPASVARAVFGVLSGRRLGGASTITMQYCRLRYGLRTRTWAGKLEQMFRAVQTERHWSKREILTAYLTLAPYGGNVEGVTAASRRWCGKTPAELTRREAVALAVLPQSPAARCPRAHEVNPALMRAQSRLLANMCALRSWRRDPLDASFCLEAQPLPREAMHAARSGLSTLDATSQRTMERVLRDFLRDEAASGLRNGSALLVHAPTGEIHGCVGSADFFDDAIHGQIDGTRMRRSPGSTLKPFVYALALDEGLIHPATLLDDAPRRFSEYQPENSDRGFLGPIKAADALWRSRNVPAVALAARLRGGGLHAWLRQNGVLLRHDSARYGLTLPLGGAEVSLTEVVRLYSLLATRGNDAAGGLSAGARFLTREMLRSAPGAPPGVAWKTGTSHGFRDAWAVAIHGDWVLGVWLGHFDGRPMPGRFARDTAEPLLFRTLAALNLPAAPDFPPSGVSRVPLCAESGALPCRHCQHRTEDWFIPGVSPISPCTVHREVWIDAASGLRVAADDGSRPLRREVREFWSAEQLKMFARAGVPRQPPPAWEPGTDSWTGHAPHIVSPQSRLVYAQQASSPERNSVPLRAEAAPGVRRITWFAGGRLIGSSRPDENLFWQPAPGEWRLRAVDDTGRVGECMVTVERVP